MTSFASWLANRVLARATEIRAASASGEVRLIFHGPPLAILESVFKLITRADTNAQPNLPIILQVPQLAHGAANPKIGETGRCDESHFLNLRNSPSASSYLALVPPGQQQPILSVSTTQDEFGVAATCNVASCPFDEWLADPFVQECIEVAVSALPKPLQGEARKLAVRALRSVDDVYAHAGSRSAAWALLSRLFSIPDSGLSPARAISLACGVPPMRSETLFAEEQHAALDGVAAALSDGFYSGLSGARENAEGNTEVLGWLEAFLLHIRSNCDMRTALERAPEAYYAPTLSLEVQPPPSWWEGLTAELWQDLLNDEPEILGQFVLECHDTILPPAKGIPHIVHGPVKLGVRACSDTGDGVAVTLERSPGKNKDGFPVALEVAGTALFEDPKPPLHKTPLNYKVHADGFRSASIKVISLDNWDPGIFIACRLARKSTSPRAPSRRSKDVQWEASVLLPGPGRFEFLIMLRPGAKVADEASGVSTSGEAAAGDVTKLPIREVKPGLHQVEVDTDGAYQIEIPFERPDKNGNNVAEICRVFVACDDVDEEGCRSEFERLIRLNRRTLDSRGAKPSIQIDRSARCTSLQGWMLLPDEARRSYLPLVLAEDYADHWVQPTWTTDAGRIISGGRFLKDPRPPASDFIPPADFLDSREELAELIRGGDDQSGVLESAPLGEWLRNDESYQALVERYLSAYAAWFSGSPEIAAWTDVVVVASLEADRRTLSRIPDAILLTPLHPLRLSWHSLAQSVMNAALSEKPCPAVGVLDPRLAPDIMRLPIRSPEGFDWIPFLAVESNSDYWSVLWNGAKLRDMPRRSRLPPLDAGFGLEVGGLSTSFSASQVVRALDDVSGVLCAKPIVSVLVSSSGGTTDSCNQGLIEWSAFNYADRDISAAPNTLGRRRLDVFDVRDEQFRPDEATIANLSDDTSNSVRWHVGEPKSGAVDLGIIAQLDSSEPEAAETQIRSPLGAGGLLRHRVRRQLPEAFLSESRQAKSPAACGHPLADKFAAALATIENGGNRIEGLRFAPNVFAISDMLEKKAADFVAISSSAVDPSCFLGNWLQHAYLWDYDLPSYSQRAGDTNGYYVLSKVKPSDRDGMKRVLGRLPDCGALGDEDVGNILLEVARRGIPTIRGLSGDDTGATGDLGLFVASRLLQDRFRLDAPVDSIIPVIGPADREPMIALVIPVDPFRRYLDDLSKVLNRDVEDATLERPDLLVVGVSLGNPVKLRITPVEVKSRLEGTLSKADALDALGQAKAIGTLFARLSEWSDPLSAWNLAYKHLLLSIIGFGMRVYSQHHDLAGDAATWAGFHERIASAILSGELCISIDRRGRLIVLDNSAVSQPMDNDGDGFDETIIVTLEDASRIIASDAAAFYSSVRAKVCDWELLIWPDADKASGNAPPASPRTETPLAVRPTGKKDAKTQEPTEASPPHPAVVQSSSGSAAHAEGGSGIKLEVGRTEGAFERRNVQLTISDTRLNQLNMGVVGDLGTGKTQLLKSLVYQIVKSAPDNRGIPPRFMIFDYKRDYSSPDFVAATGARVVRPHKIPLNLFDTGTMQDTTVPWLDRFRFFSDVLDKIYSGIGPVQRDKLKRAVRAGYDAKPDSMPTIYDVHQAYAELLDGKSDSPMAIIDDLVDMEIFERDPNKTLAFDAFLDGVVVVSLDALGQDDRSKNMLVAVMLNMFYENMLRTPKRPFVGTDPQLRAIDSYLLVDEADNIMRYEFDVLRKLLLQGREFGCGVILASQYLRHFKVNATDYREPLLTWFIHKVPNVTAAELSTLGLGNAAGEMAERVKELQNHHCLYKTFDTAGLIIRGLPFYELVARQKGEAPD